MPWLQLFLDTNPGQLDTVEQALLDAGALSVTLLDAADQPLLEPGPGETPLWNSIRLTGLFDANTDMDKVCNRLQDSLSLDSLPGLSIQPLEDRDWTRAWMDNFKPMQFGKGLWICPDGFEPPEPEAINLKLDPGLAFGTGTHATTALCLEWLESNRPKNMSVVDFGCGSGVLAIAALLLGAKHVWAIDNDPQALIACKDNAIKNQVEGAISIIEPAKDPEPGVIPEKGADLVLANILAGPLITLAPTLATFIHTDGKILLSGILESQLPEILDVYQEWFRMHPATIRDEWVCVAGTRLPWRANQKISIEKQDTL